PLVTSKAPFTPRLQSLIKITLYDQTDTSSTHYLLLLLLSTKQLERFLFDLSYNTPVPSPTSQLPHRTGLEGLPLVEEESSRPRQISAGSDRYRPP
ncbi:hypothetical protein BKA61DRAFT_488612, partial [Leptodontidium sp. MPI-SDFR-AT-0119]